MQRNVVPGMAQGMCTEADGRTLAVCEQSLNLTPGQGSRGKALGAKGSCLRRRTKVQDKAEGRLRSLDLPQPPRSEYVLARVVVGHMLIQGVCPTLIGPTAPRKRFAVGHFGGKAKK